jgi:hypothetical protein
LLSTDKVEIPQKVLEKLQMNDLEIQNFQIKKLHNSDQNGNINLNLNSTKYNSKNKSSAWENFLRVISSYLKFFKIFLINKSNIVEILYILRPLIYLSSMIFTNKKSFIPLLINLIIDLIILKSKKRSEHNFEQQKAYHSEYIYRMGRLAVYFLREPIYSLITKPFIRKLLKILRIPKFIVDIVIVLLAYYTNVYFIL